MRQSAAMHHRHTEVVDELFLNQNVRIPNGIENFANSQRRSRVASNDAEAFLQLCGHCVLEPEQVIGLQTLSQPRCLDRSQSMMNVVEQVKIIPKLQA